MAYLFNTPDQQSEMLKAVGANSVDELFDQIPQELRLDRPLRLPAPMTELELEAHMRDVVSQNVGASGRISFLGGGIYDHFIPAAVDTIAGRSEFYTAYTPYQAEASQGSLQAFFEYQTLICQLTGMDVSNASLYEGASSVVEAVLMAMRITKRHDKVVVLGSVHPEYRDTLNTYVRHLGCEVVTVPTPNGTADPNDIAKLIDDHTAAVIVQQPNFFGCLENIKEIFTAAKERGALSISVFDPISLGVLRNPAEDGADIAVAEGQSLGIPLQYGGPYLGIMACRKEFVRQMPGRLVGETVDRNGKRCFVLTLQSAREQHIRRERATSNICTNQGLLALRATVYLSLLGPQGLREVGELSFQKAHYAAEQLTGNRDLELAFESPFFKEFVVKCPGNAVDVAARARAAGFDIGPALDRFPTLAAEHGASAKKWLLVAVTESRTKTQIDGLTKAIRPN
ncbi:MAG: aminomethyl-transferring glycine dehydrogenase subunit GcvPA [Planctomycetia bacterium]|nr:aminomethyl-transferring glycine dehydrogenase subunit GcvPA [Planctomycetia bacterium]